MNFKKLAHENSYFPIFLIVLTIYSLICCLVTDLITKSFPNWWGFSCLMSFLGAIALAIIGRAIHHHAFSSSKKP